MPDGPDPKLRLMRDRREPDFRDLDPAKVTLLPGHAGWLRVTVEGDRSYLEVKAVRAFPHSDPSNYISLLDRKERDMVIGTIVDPRGLDSASRALLDEAIERQYFIPTITRVVTLKEEYGAVYCDVETDRGPRHFVAKGLRDGIQEMPDGTLLIPDIDGSRYRVPDVTRLDPRSRGLLDRIT